MSEVRGRRPIVILISGRGSNMRALLERSRDAYASYEVAAVLSDRPAALGLETAREWGVKAQAFPVAKATDRAGHERMIAAAIDAYAPTLIALAGYMRILSPEFIARFPGRILNIHPSLLAKYPGLDTHRRALDARDREHGATVHFVTEHLDAGPAVLQARMPLAAGDDADHVAARVLAEEHRIYPLAVSWYCEGRLRYRDGDAWLDGNKLLAPVQYGEMQAPKER